MSREDHRSRPVPQARRARLAAFGQMGGGVAAGMIGEGLRRLARGERPALPDLLLTPTNARRVTDQLSRLRGAAMKLGQMLSMDAGDMLPPELTAILSQLRDAAHVMPPAQLSRQLTAAWGPDWRRRFAHFDPRPIAAASIGQVHRATLPSGQELAVKVQYPGVAASIDADIDNVAMLLRISGLLPAGLDVVPPLAEAKRQLHEEADYRREAAQMTRYADLLADDPRFVVPRPVDDMLHPAVIAMDYLPGSPIETLAHAPEAQRQAALAALLDLVLREVFDFGLMQTDPNFANFRWQAKTGRIVLLDFGAARPVTNETASAYRALLAAALSDDLPSIRQALLSAGFVSEAQYARHGQAIDAMLRLLLDRITSSRHALFDFAERRFVERLRALATPLVADRASWALPPADLLFAQRKIGGIALLFVSMGAQLPLADLLAPYAAWPSAPHMPTGQRCR